MPTDESRPPVVAEVRAIRGRLAAECGNDRDSADERAGRVTHFGWILSHDTGQVGKSGRQAASPHDVPYTDKTMDEYRRCSTTGCNSGFLSSKRRAPSSRIGLRDLRGGRSDRISKRFVPTPWRTYRTSPSPPRRNGSPGSAPRSVAATGPTASRAPPRERTSSVGAVGPGDVPRRLTPRNEDLVVRARHRHVPAVLADADHLDARQTADGHAPAERPGIRPQPLGEAFVDHDHGPSARIARDRDGAPRPGVAGAYASVQLRRSASSRGTHPTGRSRPADGPRASAPGARATAARECRALAAAGRLFPRARKRLLTATRDGLPAEPPAGTETQNAGEWLLEDAPRAS